MPLKIQFWADALIENAPPAWVWSPQSYSAHWCSFKVVGSQNLRGGEHVYTVMYPFLYLLRYDCPLTNYRLSIFSTLPTASSSTPCCIDINHLSFHPGYAFSSVWYCGYTGVWPKLRICYMSNKTGLFIHKTHYSHYLTHSGYTINPPTTN